MFAFFSRGQLGRGLIVEEQSSEVVPALEGIRMQFIAAGGWHSAAISGERREAKYSIGITKVHFLRFAV